MRVSCSCHNAKNCMQMETRLQLKKNTVNTEFNFVAMINTDTPFKARIPV